MLAHFVIFFILFILAVFIGAWRQFCSYAKYENPEIEPRIWNSAIIRIASLIATAILSFLCAWEIKVAFSGWIGIFLFGAILMIRWQASGMIALSIHKSKKQQ
jgi:ABC-type glycerol-3-phosphate transport system permease component